MLDKNLFNLDNRIASSCFHLGDWELSSVLLKNTRHYPWFLLVPRKIDVTEINQLSKADRYELMDEIDRISTIIKEYFKPNKLNIGAIGNIVSQLHVHVVARFTTDLSWPHSIWQPNSETEEPYLEHENLVSNLRKKIIAG